MFADIARNAGASCHRACATQRYGLFRSQYTDTFQAFAEDDIAVSSSPYSCSCFFREASDLLYLAYEIRMQVLHDSPGVI